MAWIYLGDVIKLPSSNLRSRYEEMISKIDQKDCTWAHAQQVLDDVLHMDNIQSSLAEEVVF